LARREGGRGGDNGRDFVEYDNTAGVGTPVYGSPEQLSGGDYDEKTDIYSLGVMIFEVRAMAVRGGFRDGFVRGFRLPPTL
jgi:serine/threonine protein kinase